MALREDLQQLAISFLDAFNEADWSRYQEIIARDATYYDGTERTANNRRRSVAILRQYKTNTPGLECTPSRWAVDEVNGTVAVEIAWRSTDTSDELTIPGTFFLRWRAAEFLIFVNSTTMDAGRRRGRRPPRGARSVNVINKITLARLNHDACCYAKRRSGVRPQLGRLHQLPQAGSQLFGGMASRFPG